MSLATTRAAIAAAVAAVPDIGRVHQYERYAADLSALRKHYSASIAGAEQLRGWFVRRVSTAETSPAVGRRATTHEWEIRGYMALADAAASEYEMDALIEALREVFRIDETLGGAVASTVTDEAAGIQVVESGPVLFAGVLCHGARLQLFTRHYP